MRLAKQKIVTACVAAAMALGTVSRPASWSIAAQPPEVNLSDDRLADQALAERVAMSAQMLLQSSTINPTTLRQSAAMIEVANKLAPDEPRFLRLLTENYLQLGGSEGRDGALSSITRYLNLKPNPPDLGAQMMFIDLQFGKQETADARKQYIDQLLELPAAQLSPQVRCHVAVMAARLAVERASTSEAKRYTELALKLIPLSPDALQLAHAQMDDSTPVSKRIAMLLQMLRSNPSQNLVMSELAEELAAAGMVDSALQWYQNLFLLYQRMGVSAPSEQMVDYAMELAIGNQGTAADGILQAVLTRDPNEVNAAFASLVIATRTGKQDAIDPATDKTKAALMNRLGILSDELNGRMPPADAPAAPPPAPDIAADVKKLLENPDSDAYTPYASALGDLAWLEVYFRRKPADAETYISSLKQLLPADNMVLTRLDGWSLLADGKKGEAKVKLAAIADQDPFAQLGIILLDEQLSPADQTAAATKLLLANSNGLVGAMLVEALRDKVGLMPASADAQAIRDELNKFPREWLDILDPSKTAKFYSIKASTLKVSHAFGEPMLANITLSNTSEFPLTIGAGGTIHPELWFDVQMRAPVFEMVPGVAIERLTHTQILMPKESITLKLRVDQGPLVAKLNINPAISIPLYFNVLTNPMTQQNGVVPGPAGYRQTFMPVAERARAPINDKTLNDLFKQLQTGPGNVRLQTLDILASFARALKEQQTPELQRQGNQILDVIRAAAGDRAESVRAEARFITAVLSDEATRKGMTRQMLADKSFCERIMGLQLVQIMAEPSERKDLLKPLAENDADVLLKKLAASMIDVADLPPPSTQPSTQPTDSAAAPAAPSLLGGPAPASLNK